MSTSRPIWKFTTFVKKLHQPPFTIAGFFLCLCKFGKLRNIFQTVHNSFGHGTNLAKKDLGFDLKAWKLQVIQLSLNLFSEQNISNSKKTPWPSLAWLDCMITYHQISQICALTCIQNMYDSIFWTIECMTTGYTFIHCNPKSESHPALATIMDGTAFEIYWIASFKAFWSVPITFLEFHSKVHYLRLTFFEKTLSMYPWYVSQALEIWNKNSCSSKKYSKKKKSQAVKLNYIGNFTQIILLCWKKIIILVVGKSWVCSHFSLRWPSIQ